MKLWRFTLAAFLILWALLEISNVRFEAQHLLIGVLALAAGALLAFDR